MRRTAQDTVVVLYTKVVSKILIGKRHTAINPSNAELNPICHLLALLGAHPIPHFSRVRVNFIFRYQRHSNKTPYIFTDRLLTLYKLKVSRNRARWPKGVPGRLKPRIFLTFRHYKGGRSSAKRTSRLYPRRNPWYSLSEAESTSGYMVLSGEPRKKIPSDTTRNRPRDCPTSSAVP